MANMQLSTTFNAVDKISKPMRGMQGKVSAFGKNAERSFGGVGQKLQRMRGLIVGAAAALATGAIARSVTQFAEAGAEVNRTARQLGIGVEALQELSGVARQFGVDTEALRDGIKELSLRADEFAVTGKGPAAEAMQRLGLSMDEVAAKTDDTAGLFDLIRERLSQVENVAARQRLADEIFGGTGGEQMVEMASLTADEMARLRDEVRASGQVMGSGAAAASERFQKSLDSVKGTMQSLKAAALVPLMNIVQPLIERIQEWASANRELIQEKVAGFIQGIVDVGKTFVKLWESGLIPAILAGIATFITLTKAVAAYQVIMAAVKGAQLAAAAAGGVFNAVLAANPIGLIILAVAALITIIVLLVKNWDKVKEVAGNVISWIGDRLQAFGAFVATVAQSIWEAFKTAFDYIKAYYATVADVILTIFGGIAKAVLGVAGKVGDALGFDTSGIDRVIGKIEQVQATVRDASFVGGSNLTGGGQDAGRGMVSANEGVITSRELSENRSTVDINVNDRNGRADVRQTGQAPGVTVNTGFEFADLGELGAR